MNEFSTITSLFFHLTLDVYVPYLAKVSGKHCGVVWNKVVAVGQF